MLSLSFIFYKYYIKKFSKSQFIGTFRNVRKTLKSDLYILSSCIRNFWCYLTSILEFLLSYPIVRLSLPINWIAPGGIEPTISSLKGWHPGRFRRRSHIFSWAATLSIRGKRCTLCLSIANDQVINIQTWWKLAFHTPQGEAACFPSASSIADCLPI